LYHHLTSPPYAAVETAWIDALHAGDIDVALSAEATFLFQVRLMHEKKMTCDLI
jgi:hypothetical protein